MAKAKNFKTQSYYSSSEMDKHKQLEKLFNDCPIPKEELFANLNLFYQRQDWARALFINDLYKKILDVHGVILEFGVRWGCNLSLLVSLRGMYEPFNHNRKIIGFDTFCGFKSIDKKDGTANIISEGSYSVSQDYEKYLEQILNYHESISPISHIKKFQLVKGDATVEITKYLDNNPETIVALAYFDFDIYSPTKKCLEAIKSRLTKGSVVAFDELNCHDYPGETLALKEAFGLDKYKIARSPYTSVQSYLVVE